MTSPSSVTCDAIHPGTKPHKTDPPPNKPTFNYPKTPPYPLTSENIQNLKKWRLDQFATTVFNKSGKFLAMFGPPAHIHLKDGAILKAKHNPIPVPYHNREEVKKALWDDVKRGIITPIPIGTPTNWCSTMVITAKKNGKPRRTVDYQHLNSQCNRKQNTRTFAHTPSSKIPRALSRLLLHNRPGLKERPALIQPSLHTWGGRWRSHCPNAQDKIITTLTTWTAQLADKNMSMCGPVYSNACIATPGLEGNHCPQNAHIIKSDSLRCVNNIQVQVQYTTELRHFWKMILCYLHTECYFLLIQIPNNS